MKGDSPRTGPHLDWYVSPVPYHFGWYSSLWVWVSWFDGIHITLPSLKLDMVIMCVHHIPIFLSKFCYQHFLWIYGLDFNCFFNFPFHSSLIIIFLSLIRMANKLVCRTFMMNHFINDFLIILWIHNLNVIGQILSHIFSCRFS